MEQVVKIRVILDVEEDIFRDIEIELDAPLMHLHLSTLDAFNWDNANEMASFYQSNEAWDKGTEYPLMAMGPEFPSMENATVRDILPTPTSRGLYVYDYLRMWCFYLEPMAMGAADLVPGVSGGTIAFITGIYEELIQTIQSVNGKALKILFKEGIKSFWLHINGTFLFFLLLGIGTSIISLAKLISFLF